MSYQNETVSFEYTGDVQRPLYMPRGGKWDDFQAACRETAPTNGLSVDYALWKWAAFRFDGEDVARRARQNLNGALVSAATPDLKFLARHEGDTVFVCKAPRVRRDGRGK